jgi:hypothetical protein
VEVVGDFGDCRSDYRAILFGTFQSRAWGIWGQGKSYESNEEHREVDGGHDQKNPFEAGEIIFSLNFLDRGDCAGILDIDVDFRRRRASTLFRGCCHDCRARDLKAICGWEGRWKTILM